MTSKPNFNRVQSRLRRGRREAENVAVAEMIRQNAEILRQISAIVEAAPLAPPDSEATSSELFFRIAPGQEPAAHRDRNRLDIDDPVAYTKQQVVQRSPH